MNDVAALGGLFLSAFLAATLLPAQSESVLAVLTISGTWPLWLLVAVASAGNVLGAVVNWLLGRAVTSLRDRRWFPVSERALARAQANSFPTFCELGQEELPLLRLPVLFELGGSTTH